MNEQTSNLKIGLLDNGSHSLERGYQTWALWRDSGDAWLLKESVIWVHHGIELLLKQLVVQTNEFLVFQDVNKSVERLGILRKKSGMKNAGVLDLFDHDDKVMSVGFKNLIDRVAITLNIDELSETETLRKKIDKLTRIRNKIVHFSMDLDVVEIAGLLSEILNPLLSLLSKEVQNKEFNKKTIPKIRKVAQPLHEYIDYVRGQIVEDAIISTREAMPPHGSRRAGIVSQAQGSGLTKSLSSYLKRANGIFSKGIIVIVDNLALANQLYSVLSDDAEVSPIFPSSKEELSYFFDSENHKIALCNVQKFQSLQVDYSSDYLIVVYNMSSVPKYFEDAFPKSTYILFTHTPGQLAPSFFGHVVGSYDLPQAINDNISTPLRIESQTLDSKFQESVNFASENEGTVKRSSNGFKLLAEKIVTNFVESDAGSLRKSYIIVRDNREADILLEEILELKPDWNRGVGADDVISALSSKINDEKRERLINSFVDRDSPLTLLIGTWRFLVGCDNPLLSIVYITCRIPLEIQYRISSAVTRFEPDKNYGLIVDFCGLDWSPDAFANQ